MVESDNSGNGHQRTKHPKIAVDVRAARGTQKKGPSIPMGPKTGEREIHQHMRPSLKKTGEKKNKDQKDQGVPEQIYVIDLGKSVCRQIARINGSDKTSTLRRSSSHVKTGGIGEEAVEPRIELRTECPGL